MGRQLNAAAHNTFPSLCRCAKRRRCSSILSVLREIAFSTINFSPVIDRPDEIVEYHVHVRFSVRSARVCNAHYRHVQLTPVDLAVSRRLFKFDLNHLFFNG